MTKPANSVKLPDAVTRKRSRIALFCHNLEINGANNFLLSLQAGLRENFEFSIFSTKTGALAERYRNLGCDVTIISNVASELNEMVLGYDLVLANTLMMAPVIMACLRAKVPHILVVHETWNPSNIRYYLDELWKIDQVTAEDVIAGLKEARKIVFPANFLSDVYSDLVEPHRIATIFCPVDVDNIDQFLASNARQDIRALLGVQKNECVFLQVGTVTRRKSQLLTLQSFIAMQKRNSNLKAKLFLVGARSVRPGEKEYIAEIRHLIESEGMQDKVLIFPVREDILPFFHAADILVHPSINEVLPLAILEACAFAVPVIASRMDGIPEIIRDGLDGYLVDPFQPHSVVDAMETLALNGDLRQKMGKSARLRVAEQHSFERFKNEYLNLFDTTIDS